MFVKTGHFCGLAYLGVVVQLLAGEHSPVLLCTATIIHDEVFEKNKIKTLNL